MNIFLDITVFSLCRAEEQPFFDGVFLANDKDVATFVDCVREKTNPVRYLSKDLGLYKVYLDLVCVFI